MLVEALLKASLHPTPSPSSLIPRRGLIKLVSHGPLNSRCLRPPYPAPLAGSPPFRKDMALAAHRHSKGPSATPPPSTTSMKPPHFSLTLISSPCPIMLNSTARFGPKLLGYISLTLSADGSFLAHLASMIVAISLNRVIAKWLFPPFLRATFVVRSPSINSPPSLLLGMQKMKMHWTSLLLHVVRWSVLSMSLLRVSLTLRFLLRPVALIRPHPHHAYRTPPVAVLLLWAGCGLSVWILLNLYLSPHLRLLPRPYPLTLLLLYMVAKANLPSKVLWA